MTATHMELFALTRQMVIIVHFIFVILLNDMNRYIMGDICNKSKSR